MQLRKLLTGQLGFTMVELLVVISIIGILATAVLAALNPVEQLRKGRDTSRKADAQTLLGALDRFQASFGCYPWAWNTTTNTCGSTAVTAKMIVAGDFTSTTTPPGQLSQLMVKDELKTQFTQRASITGQDFYISADAANNGQVSICFEPESATARGGGLGPIRNSINTAAGTCSTAYTTGDQTGTTTCAVCVPQ